jgi:nitrogen fixation NifU-like protein
MSFEMYQDNILDHYENPFHQGTLEHPTFEIRDLNPLCGDEVRIQARLDDEGRLATVRF